jgi:hypothetical protein
MRGTMERPSSSSWRAFVSRPSEARELRTAPRVPARGVSYTGGTPAPQILAIEFAA